jgi:signal peptidase I
MRKNNKEIQTRELVDRLGRPSVAMLDAEIAWHARRRSYRRVLLGVLISLVTTAAAVIIVTNLWLSVLQVEGSSMNPTLAMNEIVLAVTGADPGKGDVIAFQHNNALHIKRVIAVGGDSVSIDAGGAVTVNGSRLREPDAAEPALGHCDIDFPFQVPAGTVFVLGDNRPASLDSRDSRFGPVDRERIIGRVVFRAWPLRGLGKVS